MKSGPPLKAVTDYLWKALVCAFAYATGLVISRLLCSSLGFHPPRLPEQADESIAGFYLLIGSLVLAAGLAPVARRITGTYWTRWLVLAAFLFITFGVNNPIEDSIYSSTEGILLMIPVLWLPCVLFAGIMTLLFKPPDQGDSFAESASHFFQGRTTGQWAGCFLGAIAAFPVVYFVFGLIVSPIVVEYYRQGVSDLVLPDVGVILSIQLLRSLLFLLASLPVLILWAGARRQRIVVLGLAFFVLAATFEIVLAYKLPVVLRVTHSLEILADSLVYAWLLVKLLTPREVPSSR